MQIFIQKWIIKTLKYAGNPVDAPDFHFRFPMASAESRRALPFSDAEKVMQSAPYKYTSGTVPVKEKDADYIFYQTWSDARVEQKNCDVYSLIREPEDGS